MWTNGYVYDAKLWANLYQNIFGGDKYLPMGSEDNILVHFYW